MGKLYDRRDLEWELAYIDRTEQQTYAEVANGTLSPMFLQSLNIHSEQKKRPNGQVTKSYFTIFDQERRRARMRLLRTGQLIADFTHAKRVTRACGGCFEGADGRLKACPLHKRLWRSATISIKYAVEENEARRIALNQPPRTDEAPHDGECNKWEQLYFADKRIKAWPGNSPEELAYNKEQFDSLDYRGWLNMMRYNAEEISEDEFRSELRRLGGTV